MARIKFDYKEFDDLMGTLKSIADSKTVKRATEDALKAAFDIVTPKAEEAIKKHVKPVGKYGTGETLSTLRRTPEYVWVADICECKVGFNIKEGGLPSIFLMYGTPKVDKDQELYDAFFGNQTKREISAAQEDVLMGALSEAWRK